ncbi:MAG: phosphatase PAP2 family protein [Candidatus Lokiarchaeota archaeon]|nr:phosphatase PAP2 family protein [Candidatus Lokiarchaeota archaeon]
MVDEKETSINVVYKENKEFRNSLLIIGGITATLFTVLFRMHGWAYNFTTDTQEWVAGALDLNICAMFYNGDADSWLLDIYPNAFWEFLYENDYSLIGILGLVCLIFLIIGITDKKRKPFVKYALFMLITAAITAGLIANVLFKGFWGRYRPRDTIYFEGLNTFFLILDPAWLIEPSSIGEGKSFPAGHPSAFTCYIVVFFMFNHPEVIVHLFGEYKDWKLKMCKVIKYFAFVVSFAGGILMGLERVLEGGHFPSDVLWNFIFTYNISALMYYSIFKIPKFEKTKMAELLNLHFL